MTISLVDERSVGKAGKEIKSNDISCKRGTDPPKKSAERKGAFLFKVTA